MQGGVGQVFKDGKEVPTSWLPADTASYPGIERHFCPAILRGKGPRIDANGL